MKKHSQYAAAIIEPYCKPEIVSLVLHHHERMDGNGYPSGLKGDQIPLGARMIAVADAYDAIITERVYHSEKSEEEALKEIQACNGTQFDPECVKALIEIISKKHELEKA